MTLGVWAGLTVWEGPTVLGGLFACFLLLQTVDEWSVILALLCFGLYAYLRGFGSHLLGIWAANLITLVWTHREGLQQLPRVRSLRLRRPQERG